MSSSIKLSYILPIYNVEKYLSDCLDSIFAQKIPENEFEVICVNDCSPDNSRSIILKYQEKHNNIILIEHTHNKKAGGARNTGLSVAKGKYIWFIDSDDTIALDATSILLEKLENKKVDVLCFNYQLVYDDKVKKVSVFEKEAIYNKGYEFLLFHFSDALVYHLGYAVRCVYKRRLLLDNKIKFPEQIIFGEDTTFMAEACMSADEVMIISDLLYNYYQRDSSSSTKLSVSMRGEQIYESIFLAGNLVNKLKNKAQLYSQELSNKIENGIPWFLNRLFIRLVRTSKVERNIFYKISSSNNTDIPIGDLLSYMDFKNRFIVKNPYLGGLLLNILSFLYKLKNNK